MVYFKVKYKIFIGNMAGRKKKVPAYQVQEIEHGRMGRKQAESLEDRLNGFDTDPKLLAINIIQELPKLEFKNKKQKEFYKLLTTKEVVVCQGAAGTGKSYLAVRAALDLLISNKNNISRIYLTKPAQQLATENLGFIKGGVDEKLAPIMESYDGIFEDIIGHREFKRLVEERIIVYKPLAFLRGQTLSNAVILFDEVQMSSIHACRTLMQRLGENSHIILLGDKDQTETKNRNGNPLTHLYNKFQDYEQFGTFEFLRSDVVRNPLIEIFENIFEEIENEVANQPRKK